MKKESVWVVIPRPKNENFQEVKRNLVDYICEIQNNGYNVSCEKHYFEACESILCAEIPWMKLRTYWKDMSQACVYKDTYFCQYRFL
jgi:hypothetical protein